MLSLFFSLLTVFIGGMLCTAIAAKFAPLPLQIGTVGALVSVLAGLLASSLEPESERQARFDILLEQLRIPMVLAADHQLFDDYNKFATGLVEIANKPSPIHKIWRIK